MTTEIMATCGSVSHETSGRPIWVRKLLIRPNPGWYSQIQIRAITETGRTYGAKKVTLKNHRAGMARLASSARPREMSVSRGVTSNVNRTECHNELQKSGSAKSSL